MHQIQFDQASIILHSKNRRCAWNSHGKSWNNRDARSTAWRCFTLPRLALRRSWPDRQNSRADTDFVISSAITCSTFFCNTVSYFFDSASSSLWCLLGKFMANWSKWMKRAPMSSCLSFICQAKKGQVGLQGHLALGFGFSGFKSGFKWNSEWVSYCGGSCPRLPTLKAHPGFLDVSNMHYISPQVWSFEDVWGVTLNPRSHIRKLQHPLDRHLPLYWQTHVRLAS